MTSTVPNYRWSASEFLRAWEAGAFDHRAELIEGEVWPVVIADWHGKTVGRVIGQLARTDADVTTSTLPSGDSLPDPDCWVCSAGAEPEGRIGSRLSMWAPADVLLVVEVSDETMMADLTTKAKIYGSAGWPVYWVVTTDVVFEHTEPTQGGYRTDASTAGASGSRCATPTPTSRWTCSVPRRRPGQASRPWDQTKVAWPWSAACAPGSTGRAPGRRAGTPRRATRRSARYSTWCSTTLEQIARRVGYGDAFALSTALRRERGVSPRQYRQSLRSAG